MGILPVEFILRDLISTEILAVKENSELLNEILEGYTTTTIGGAALLQYISEYFANVAIKVVVGYPRDNSLIPCVAITIGNKQETDKFFGGYIGDEISYDDPNDPTLPTEYRDEVGFFSSSTYRLTCLANTGDITVVLAAIVETALMRNRLVFSNNGMFQNEIGVSDDIPLPEYLPVTLYNRVVSFSCRQATTAKLTHPVVTDVTLVVGTDVEPSIPISG